MQLENDPDLTALAEEIAGQHHVPGVSVGVIADGRALVATVGVTSTTDPLPVTEDTLFLIGSTSKTFTATALMALVDQGRITLDDRVIDHLPDFALADQDVARTVTIRQLLNHTGGFRGDVLGAVGWGEDALASALSMVTAAPQELPPGEVFSYNNAAFLVAGHLLATVSGTSFEAAVRTLVLTPLRLDSSGYFPWEIAHRRHAVGHVIRDDAAVAVPTYPVERWLAPAGGLWSSVRDQLAYARYHLDGTTAGTAPLLEATRLQMQQPTVTARSGLDGVGLSWLLTHHGDVPLVTHGGNVSNLQTSTFVLAPEHGLAVTVLTNSKHARAIGAKVQEWALERFLGVGTPPELATVSCEPEELVGLYDMGPYAWSLTSTDGRLFVEMTIPDDVSDDIKAAFANPARELVAVGSDVFALASSPTAPVLDVRRRDGRIEGIVHGLRFARRLP